MADVLIHTKFSEAVMEPLMKRYDCLYVNSQRLRDTVSSEQFANARAIVLAGGGDRMTASLFDVMPRLRALICFGSGYDNVDLDEAARRGAVVGHSPGANAGAVAEHAVALLMSAIRQVAAADVYVRNGGWAARTPSPFFTPVKSLTDRRVGIFGAGAISKKIIPYILASGAEVAYGSRSRHDEISLRYFATLEELADWADTLIVAVRASPDNNLAVNADILRRLGPDGVVVNIARGTVLDQAALADALRHNRITAAGLDVFETEPSCPAELIGLQNVVLSPHVGGNTLSSRTNMLDCAMANLDAFFSDKPLPYPVRPALARAGAAGGR